MAKQFDVLERMTTLNYKNVLIVTFPFGFVENNKPLRIRMSFDHVKVGTNKNSCRIIEEL